ncbi:Mucosa-associated lymphoid tissue lymphoma translocation protein 1 [Acipenser ruthenus]|uniref:Mucosa-associated lymphoid tissue lymphoma translocation protein 1 n=1 Tax=Acipenser ruthenus TaxID=7906 RepID=A0A444V3I9_ACIRT|nr:Mucosa-associated lymphoid tissue lymphoma translocation protein 1 [Acipenser ruthenus]
MGNMNYKFHRQLRAPMADVHELANLLRQLHFKVVSLLDLDRQEMHSAVREFLLLLDRGLLYYAGHGYENYGNSFMVPIDAPASYTSEHCLWVQDILQRMQERRTGLNVFLLDMCRKRNMNDDIIPQPGALKVTANIVFGYATCVDAEAYEVNKGCLSNGIFMSFLKERLLEDEKVTVLLDKVAEVLPECRHLCFDCGVRVQLGFAAEFSNIMIIYTRILEKPSEIIHCETRLIDFPEDLDVDLKITNRQLPEDTGSLLFTVDSFQFPESSCLYTRLSALQRLKRELKFSLCLQYQYCHMDEFVEEIQTVNVGKPLVAKLNLHESTPPPFSPVFDLRSLSFTGEPCSSLLQSSSFTECLAGGGSLTSLGTSGASSLGSASTCWSYHSNPGELLDPASPRRVNLPEETVSPEFLDLEAPRPLSENPQGFTSSASMPYTGLGDVPFQFRSKQNFNSF